VSEIIHTVKFFIHQWQETYDQETKRQCKNYVGYMFSETTPTITGLAYPRVPSDYSRVPSDYTKI
jgi:hypothetical protein